MPARPAADVALVDSARLGGVAADQRHRHRRAARRGPQQPDVRRQAGAQQWVLRRPPAGPLLPTAHDVVREYRVLDLLVRAEPPVRVPRPVAVCEDPAVLGAPFYLMEHVDGVVVRDTLPGWLDEPARHALGLDLATAFAEIHRVDVEPFVAAGLGRPDGYLARQLRRWTGQREGIQAAVARRRRARPRPARLRRRPRLAGRAPARRGRAGGRARRRQARQRRRRPGGGAGRRRGARLGDGHGRRPAGRPRLPAVVLAGAGKKARGQHRATRWPSWSPPAPASRRDELVAAWEQATGRAAGDLTWFVTLAIWKLAVLLEASYHRHLAGSTDDPFFATLEQRCPALLAHARETCRG